MDGSWTWRAALAQLSCRPPRRLARVWRWARICPNPCFAGHVGLRGPVLGYAQSWRVWMRSNSRSGQRASTPWSPPSPWGRLPTRSRHLAECRRVARPRGLLGLVVSDRWWWEGDDRWGWHSDLLESVGVRIQVDPFPSTDIPSVLALTGWELRDLGAESFPLVFSGADEWWAWAWSHGYRQILDSIGADQIERYRREAFGHLPQNGQPVLGRLEVTLALAVRPDA